MRGIGKDVRLVDASFIWTEEHSKRIKVKVTVQKEIASGSVLQQTMVCEFTIVNQQCEDCQKSFTPHTWNAVVQVRQKVAHRRTLCFLEQLILKHDAHEKVISLNETREGMDFHFAQRSHAQRFSDFVQSFIPAKLKNSKHLVSHDTNSNEYHYKYAIQSELCPVCTDDLVVIPKGHSDLLSASSPLMICHKMSTSVHLLDPLTLRGCDLPAYEYWKRPLEPAATRSQMTEFVVLNVEEVKLPETGTRAKHHLAGRGKMKLADIEIARAQDFGSNDERLIVRSHLGAILRPGNHVLGYDLRYINLSGIDDENLQAIIARADIFLVKKVFQRKKNRAWELRRLEREREEGAPEINDNADMEAMKQDLEEDEEMRRHVNMYRQEIPSKPKPPAPSPAADISTTDPVAVDAADIPVAESDDDLDENVEVPLAELLEGLDLNGGDDV
jgi:nonsense-mediated mRNA decay protein 3